jgi:fatty acid/phospholipid biosynthesis enzyme
MKQRFDYEKYGGSPLLGVRGVSIVTHGRAKARMIEHAIAVASEAATARIPDVIAEWSRSHPVLHAAEAPDAQIAGTQTLATGPGAGS